MTDFGSALVAELARKSGLVWISYHGATHLVWHEWHDDAVCVVAGGTEQPLPDIAAQDAVILGLRSKTSRQLVAEAEARVEVVRPHSAEWDGITTALKAGRLNLADPDHAIERWAQDSVVARLVPTGLITSGDEIDNTLARSSPLLSGN